jgi:hypothetical protein
VGQWPKDVSIVRITRIVVYAGAIIDSVRITYQLALLGSPPVTEKHGGDGGVVALDVTLAGNFYFVLEHSNLLTP